MVGWEFREIGVRISDLWKGKWVVHGIAENWCLENNVCNSDVDIKRGIMLYGVYGIMVVLSCWMGVLGRYV